MEFHEFKLPKCNVFLNHEEIGRLLTKDIEIHREAYERGYVTAEEVNTLLMKDTSLYKDVLKRSKYMNRYKQLKERQQAKWEQEGQSFH